MTYVACLTPAGVGAIASLAVCGPQAWEAVRNLFQPRSGVALPPKPHLGKIYLGRMGTDLADEVIVAARALEPVPRIEIHCHGGREVINMLLELFEAQGIQRCSWQEIDRFTAVDPLAALATEALVQAPTARTASIVLDQHQGAYRRAVEAILAAAPPKALELLAELARFTSLGRHLTTPWKVVIAGAPNVGKSSLINALAGYPRCVVSPIPGTTRDLVSTLIAVDGWPIELIDTAGIRESSEGLESEGITLAQQAVQSADLCLWVLDSSTTPVWPTVGEAKLIINKIDLPNAWDLGQAGDAVQVSAQTGMGLDGLCAKVSNWLVPIAPDPGLAVPFTSELCAAVEQAQCLLARGDRESCRQTLIFGPLPRDRDVGSSLAQLLLE